MGDGGAPVFALAADAEQFARLAFAVAEVAVVEDQAGVARGLETLSESREPQRLDRAETVGHHDDRWRALVCGLGQVQPRMAAVGPGGEVQLAASGQADGHGRHHLATSQRPAAGMPPGQSSKFAGYKGALQHRSGSSGDSCRFSSRSRNLSSRTSATCRTSRRRTCADQGACTGPARAAALEPQPTRTRPQSDGLHPVHIRGLSPLFAARFPAAAGSSQYFASFRPSGDGGNRTHVRGRAKVTSTSVAGALISPSTSLAGRVVECQPPESPRIGEGRPHRASPLSDPGDPHRRRVGAKTSYLVLPRPGGRTRESPHVLFFRVFYEASRNLGSQPPPLNRPRRSLSSPGLCCSHCSRPRNAPPDGNPAPSGGVPAS